MGVSEIKGYLIVGGPYTKDPTIGVSEMKGVPYFGVLRIVECALPPTGVFFLSRHV